tara:strand:+ start:269 stop:550 length:282 start_codon:yes stop_codon:yes gene_type:complete
MTMFDVLADIIKHKTGKLHEEEDFKKAFNVFMVIRYLSMDERFSDAAYIANQLHNNTLSQENMYKLLIKIVPRSNNHFIKYISKAKNDKKERK